MVLAHGLLISRVSSLDRYHCLLPSNPAYPTREHIGVFRDSSIFVIPWGYLYEVWLLKEDHDGGNLGVKYFA
ncbi:unnamed protein product, partial [Dovyalis caffra]